jgi:hypothetical protein
MRQDTNNVSTDPEVLLKVARQLCDRPAADLAGRWPRAVAILTRAALEAILDDYWQIHAPGVDRCAAQRPKMLCLPSYLDNAALAHTTYQTWASLSAACHRHAYELDPVADDLLAWVTNVEALRAELLNPLDTPRGA